MKGILWTIIAFSLSSLEVSETCVHSKGLVNKIITTSEISQNYRMICDQDVKHFSGVTMGHISPIYDRGKELSITYAKKFDIISPIWFTVDYTSKGYEITGKENYDQAYLNKLKEANPSLKIIPRYSLSGKAVSNFHMQYGKPIKTLVKTISNHAKEYGFNGVELETSVYLLQTTLRYYMVQLIRELATSLHEDLDKSQLIVTIYLYKSLTTPLVDLELFSELESFVDYFNLLSYEFGRDYLHAPIQWAKNALNEIVNQTTVTPEKVLVGIPFFGCKFTTAREMTRMEALITRFLWEDSKEPAFITWNEEAEEHSATYRKFNSDKTYESGTVLLPTLYVILYSKNSSLQIGG
eukprot:TRINITY_DN3827_c0_g2_i1.p1 TRINITY_DN3827_c0_g2~~TRINITY_DN3827_c0_g2_i1.p1  ORF type:complete len:382 (+),score=19.19 TRINITY_DN3827_c0_g2_i1:93-1148(+)